MIKQVIKEIGICIMLLIAIALILSIVFYEYIPNNKTVPIAVKAYTISEDIQEELNESLNQDEQNIVITKYISDDELDVYESKKSYNKGKANPFADYSNNETNNTTSNKNSTNTSSPANNKLENTNQNEVYVSTSGKN